MSRTGQPHFRRARHVGCQHLRRPHVWRHDGVRNFNAREPRPLAREAYQGPAVSKSRRGHLLVTLAGECRLSTRHFSRAFRRSKGMAPHQWLLPQRCLATVGCHLRRWRCARALQIRATSRACSRAWLASHRERGADVSMKNGRERRGRPRRCNSSIRDLRPMAHFQRLRYPTDTVAIGGTADGLSPNRQSTLPR
jgi:AraC-like DNA-binding protein